MSEETSEKLEGNRRPPIVGRGLIGVLVFQLGLPAAFAPNARQIPASRCPIPPCPTG